MFWGQFENKFFDGKKICWSKFEKMFFGENKKKDFFSENENFGCAEQFETRHYLIVICWHWNKFPDLHLHRDITPFFGRNFFFNIFGDIP